MFYLNRVYYTESPHDKVSHLTRAAEEQQEKADPTAKRQQPQQPLSVEDKVEKVTEAVLMELLGELRKGESNLCGGPN